MKKKSIYVGMLLMVTMLAGCGKQEEESAGIFESVSNEASTEAEESGMKDGERFDDVIILEGMEETVHYEHIINDSLGLEMDYDYESFTRKSEPESERFISIYDDADKPENYLEVTRSADDAETTADSIGKELSEEYDITRSDMELDQAGSCIKISASEDKNTHGTADMIYSVYIIPREDGCLIAKASMYFEASEGFGRRFNYMINTIR